MILLLITTNNNTNSNNNNDDTNDNNNNNNINDDYTKNYSRGEVAVKVLNKPAEAGRDEASRGHWWRSHIFMYVIYGVLFYAFMLLRLFAYTPSPPTKSLGFRGFDSSRLLILRGGNSHVRRI